MILIHSTYYNIFNSTMSLNDTKLSHICTINFRITINRGNAKKAKVNRPNNGFNFKIFMRIALPTQFSPHAPKYVTINRLRCWCLPFDKCINRFRIRNHHFAKRSKCYAYRKAKRTQTTHIHPITRHRFNMRCERTIQPGPRLVGLVQRQPDL